MSFHTTLRLGIILTATLAGQLSNPVVTWADRTLWSATHSSAITLSQDETVIIENHNYLYTRCFVSISDDRERLVVSQKSKWHRGPWEGNNPILTATAFIIDKTGGEKKLWQISEKADEGFLSCDFYRTVWYGCCTAAPNNRLYNVRTGRLVNEYSQDLLKIQIPNTPIERYIGYKTAETIHHHPWEAHARHIGTLTYSSAARVLHRLVIRGRGDKYEDKFGFGHATMTVIPGSQDHKLNGKTTLDLWTANGLSDPKQITGFKIKLEFDAISVQVPIKADDFFCDKTVFPDFEFVSIQALD